MDGTADISLGVMRIMPEHVVPLWPQLKTLFLPALALQSTHTMEDLRHSIMAREAELWCDMQGDRVLGALVSRFIRYPQGLYVQIWEGGARRDHPLNYGGFMDVLEKWRVGHGCIGFEIFGREGWVRKFPQARVEGLILRWNP